MITIETYYITKSDKPLSLIRKLKKVKIERDNCEIMINIEKEKNIEKIVKVLEQNNITNVVLSKKIIENKNLKNMINAYGIHIFDGRWLIKYLAIDIIDYIMEQKNIKKEETEIAITTNEITDLNIETIKILAKQYKRVTIVTNHIEKLRKIEKEIFEKEGILIIVSNNQKKSLVKAEIILNMDFDKEVLNKYKINEKAIIINLEGNMKIENKRFNGIVINDYEIEVGREEGIWRENMQEYKAKDLLESSLYRKDTYKHIISQIKKNRVIIKELYGINGKIERFS